MSMRICVTISINKEHGVKQICNVKFDKATQITQGLTRNKP